MQTIPVIEEFRQSTAALLGALQLFSQEELNQVPFDGSWTPGQVGQHLLKSETGVSELFRGNKQAPGRDPDALSPQIRAIFLDFSTRMQSPEFIVPDNTPQDRGQLLQALERNREEILRAASGTDLDLQLQDFAVPQLGELTGREWLTFVTAHSLRHVNQLQNIHRHITR